ncbi:MAG: type III-B CRISPR module RAMP protein Cmr4 [Cyanobacteria bacterium J06621_12]
MFDYNFLYLLSPLHTGGTTQEGNLVGIARESHTNFPYIPSSSIRGRIRASVEDKELREKLFGTELPNSTNSNNDEEFAGLKQGCIWIGDASILWIPIASLSHGVVWISSPMLLRRWTKFDAEALANIPPEYSCNFYRQDSSVFLKDAILKATDLKPWEGWQDFVPQTPQASSITKVLVLPDQHCATLIQMSLWRQVKINLTESKSVKDGSFRYEEAIPPDTLMHFPWGINSAAKNNSDARGKFEQVLTSNEVIQIGGQESLGRGFVQQWLGKQQAKV